MEIFKLFGSVLVETSGAEKNLNDVDKKAQGLTEKIGGYIKSAAAWAAGIAAAVVAAGSWLISQANEVSAYGDEIDKKSQQLGFTTREYQEWEHVLQHYGTSLANVGKKISQLYTDVAQGKDATIEALGQIGITMYEAASMTPGELFDRVVTGLQGIGDQGTRAAVAEDLLGSAAKELNPLLNATAEATAEAKSHVEALRALMTDEQVTNAANYADAVFDFQTAWGGFTRMIGNAILPGMTRLLNWITNTGLPGIRDFCSGVKEAIDAAWQGINDFVNGTGSFSWLTQEVDLSGLFGGGKTEELPASPAPWGRQKGSHASGLDFVPWPEGLVKVHYGEKILNKADADDYRQGNTGRGQVNVTINVSSVPQTPAELAAATAAAFERAVWAT